MKRLFAITAVILLAGCKTASVFPPEGGPPWKDVDNNGVELYKGAAECKYQATVGADSATGVHQQADVAGDLYDSCMRRRGY